RKFGEAHPEIAAHFGDARKQRIENIEKLECDTAGERTSAVGRSMHAAADSGRRDLVRGDEAERESAGDRFRGDHYVRQNRGIEHLIGEMRARPADAALNFVEDEQSVVARRDLARFADVIGGEWENSTLALNEFEDDGGGAVAGGVFESAD